MHRRDAGALQVCVCVSCQEGPRLTVRQDAAFSERSTQLCAKTASKSATKATEFPASLHMHGVRGSCSDHYNKDSY